MNKEQVITATANYVKTELSGEGTGHDWWHIYRVWKLAERIAVEENADTFVVELAILLHDIADHKFHDGDHEIGLQVSRDWLIEQGVEHKTIEHVLSCIKVCSYSKGESPTSIEAEIVQDADRLDAIGAVGIARVFATGAHFKEIFYDPEQPKDAQKTVIGHFYEKLLKLRGLMNTKTGKEIARERHAYLEEFLEQFYAEWEGSR